MQEPDVQFTFPERLQTLHSYLEPRNASIMRCSCMSIEYTLSGLLSGNVYFVAVYLLIVTHLLLRTAPSTPSLNG